MPARPPIDNPPAGRGSRRIGGVGVPGDVAKAVTENVRLQAETLVEASTVISALVKAGKVIVAGGVFDLESGRVQPVALG